MSFSTPIKPGVTPEEIDDVNNRLRDLAPQEILQWALEHLPNLYQTTAFGLTGLVILDMVSKMPARRPPLIFIDTLYHFPETLELVKEVEQKYGEKVIVYKPDGCDNVAELEQKYGEKLWEVSEDTYDYVVKVEPGRRAYADLGVQSVITGRRASQGGARASLQPLEKDETGLLKLNPLFAWSFAQVQAYGKEHNVPRNKLLDQGFRSVGDWHSTQKSGEGDSGERAGRWAGKKSECGLHTDYFAMKIKMKKEEESRKAAEESLQNTMVHVEA